MSKPAESSSTSPKRRLKVLFYIGSLDAGGAEHQVLELIRWLNRFEFEPVLGLAARRGALLTEVPDDVPIHSFQETVQRSGRLGLGRLQRWNFLANLLKQQKIDVVYDRTFLATLDSGPASWWQSIPRISAIVADPAVQMELYFPTRQWLARRLARFLYRTADMVLTNSAGLRQQVLDYFQLKPGLVREIPNGLNLERIDRLAGEFLPEQRGAAFQVLTVGRIDEHKGHRDLLEALGILVHDQRRTNIRWTILGDGPARPELLAEAERLQLISKINWRGVLPNPYPYFRAANVFCLPSLSEGSPNVLLEALALGVPVIATDCRSGPREILENGRWGTLTPVLNPAALASAIADHLDRRTEHLSIAAAAKPVIREQYDIRRMVVRFEELLKQVAHKNSIRPLRRPCAD